jgi:large subunit ribosomal protein L5
MAKEKTTTKTVKEKTKKAGNDNIMRKIRIEKVVLSIGGTADKLEKGFKLLERLSGKKAVKIKSTKRIPSFGVRPGLEVGCMVTLRGEEASEMLKRLFVAVDHILKRKQFSENSFSFGVHEYIEIPGIQYQRDIGIMGFDISVTFVRPGKRVVRKKLKQGRLPKKQHIPKEEITKFMEDNYKIKLA